MYPNTVSSPIEETHAREIMHIINTSMSSPEGIVAAMAHEHRTIQQGFTRIVVAWLEYLANLEHGEFDPRNEASVRLAKNIVGNPNWEKLKYLPYI